MRITKVGKNVQKDLIDQLLKEFERQNRQVKGDTNFFKTHSERIRRIQHAHQSEMFKKTTIEEIKYMARLLSMKKYPKPYQNFEKSDFLQRKGLIIRRLIRFQRVVSGAFSQFSPAMSPKTTNRNMLSSKENSNKKRSKTHFDDGGSQRDLRQSDRSHNKHRSESSDAASRDE